MGISFRWAAKEAAIKAYSRRRLRYRDVIIASMPIHDLQKNIPVALINPPKPMIMMTDEVARNRGLVDHARKETNDPMNDHPKPRRWARTIMSERQIARLSISHDGEYAIAVVQAFDESSALPSSIPIMDKGYGDPIHEPLIGDVGYDTYDLDAAIGNSPENMSYLY